MKKMIIAAVLLLSSISQADYIECYFKNPSIRTTYSMAEATLTYRDKDGTPTAVKKNVHFQIKGAGQFELITNDYKVIQSLSMYDHAATRAFPYQVKDYSMGAAHNNGTGECVSDRLGAHGY